MSKNVGIVGVGAMGGAIARRLLSQGWEVTLWNLVPEDLDAFDGIAGARRAETPAEAAAVGRVITSVANDQAVRDVTTGPNGIAAGLPEGGTHISMSTVSPDVVTEMAAVSGPTHFVSAPVFGRPVAAEDGKLWVALSGPEAGRAAAKEVLADVSQLIKDFGDAPESAVHVKIAGNFVIASAIEAMSEAFDVLRRSGTDPRLFHEMMSESIFASVIHQNYGRIILDEAFDPPGFRLALGGKDIGLARDLARNSGTTLPFGDILAKRFASAAEQGYGDKDWNAISKFRDPVS